MIFILICRKKDFLDNVIGKTILLRSKLNSDFASLFWLKIILFVCHHVGQHSYEKISCLFLMCRKVLNRSESIYSLPDMIFVTCITCSACVKLSALG